MIGIALSITALAHPGGHGNRAEGELRAWTNVVTGEMVKASFLFAREGQIYVERASGDAVVFPLNELAEADRKYAEEQIARIRQKNHQIVPRSEAYTLSVASPFPASFWPGFFMLACGACALILFRKRNRAMLAACLLLMLACGYATRQQAQTNRPAAAAPFDAYSPKVRTRWDDKYLYVESNGIPDHPLMAGIRTWQQQVPVPQPYYIRDPESGKPFFILDTTGQTTALPPGNDPVILLTKTQLMIRDQRQTRITELKDMPDFYVDRARLEGWMDWIAGKFAYFFFPLGLIFSFIFRMFTTLIYALVGLIFNAVFNNNLSFGALMRLAAVATSPVIYINTIFWMIGHEIPLWILLGFALTCVYVAFAVKWAEPRTPNYPQYGQPHPAYPAGPYAPPPPGFYNPPPPPPQMPPRV